MDRKVPKTMALRNKNAPKVPNSGTPEVGNQLVRMRSGIPLLKDTETGTAPHTALSNTSPENIARTQETGSRNPAPCFFMFPITAPYPARKCESVSGSHQSDAIPTGASFPHPATYRRGIAWSGTNI